MQWVRCNERLPISYTMHELTVANNSSGNRFIFSGSYWTGDAWNMHNHQELPDGLTAIAWLELEPYKGEP